MEKDIEGLPLEAVFVIPDSLWKKTFTMEKPSDMEIIKKSGGRRNNWKTPRPTRKWKVKIHSMEVHHFIYYFGIKRVCISPISYRNLTNCVTSKKKKQLWCLSWRVQCDVSIELYIRTICPSIAVRVNTYTRTSICGTNRAWQRVLTNNI
jgi:hypothetical protein